VVLQNDNKSPASKVDRTGAALAQIGRNTRTTGAAVILTVQHKLDDSPSDCTAAINNKRYCIHDEEEAVTSQRTSSNHYRRHLVSYTG